MNELFVFLLIGLLYLVLGFPLFLGKIKRNSLYGFRVEKTLSDDKYWFPVNKVAGKWFMIAGIAIVIAALAISSSSISALSQMVVMTVIISITTALPVVFGLKQLKQIGSK